MSEQFDTFEHNEAELTIEQKKYLVGAWHQIIADNKLPEKDIKEMSNSELKAWLKETVLESAFNIAEEWGIVPQEKFNIESDDIKEKTGQELAFIMDLKAKIADFIRINPRDFQTSRYCFYSRAMQSRYNFNCVGISTIACSIFDSVGAEHYMGQVAGHVLNVVKLSDGRWMYVDYNNKQSIKEFKPEISKRDGHTIFDFNQEGLRYRHMILVCPDEVPVFVLSSFRYFVNNMQKGDNTKTDIDMENEHALLEENKIMCEKIDISKISDILYPDLSTLSDSREMQKERERLQK